MRDERSETICKYYSHIANEKKNCLSNIVTMFPNHGDRLMNRRVLEKLGYHALYQDIDKDFLTKPRHYVVLNLCAETPFRLRVCTNMFHENTRFIEFY